MLAELPLEQISTGVETMHLSQRIAMVPADARKEKHRSNFAQVFFDAAVDLSHNPQRSLRLDA